VVIDIDGSSLDAVFLLLSFYRCVCSYAYIVQWVKDNKMILVISKTKEIVMSLDTLTGKATDFQFGRYPGGPSERKSIKNLGEKGAWGSQGLPNFFEYPLLSQERVKLRTFVRTFTGSIEQKPISTSKP